MRLSIFTILLRIATAVRKNNSLAHDGQMCADLVAFCWPNTLIPNLNLFLIRDGFHFAAASIFKPAVTLDCLMSNWETWKSKKVYRERYEKQHAN